MAATTFEAVGLNLTLYQEFPRSGLRGRLSVGGERSRVLPVAIVASGRAAPTVAELAEALSTGARPVSEADVGVLYRAAEDEGLVDPWPGDEPRVTLSPLGAEALGVRFAAGRHGGDPGPGDGRWVPRWARRRAAKLDDLAATRTRCEVDTMHSTRNGGGAGPPVGAGPEDEDLSDMVGLDAVADPGAREPWQVLAAAELMAGADDGRRTSAGLDEARFPAPRAASGMKPLPLLVTGVGMPWPALDSRGDRWTRAGGEPCPNCGGRPAPDEFCCVDECERYGREHMLPHVSLHERPRPYREDKLRGGRGKARKAKAG